MGQKSVHSGAWISGRKRSPTPRKEALAQQAKASATKRKKKITLAPIEFGKDEK